MKTFRPPALHVALVGVLSSTAAAQWTVVEMGAGTRLSGVHGSQQVGTSGLSAGLWQGSSASFVGLGSGASAATDGASQVGTTSTGHAALWTGSAGSLVDLHPDGYGASAATGVDGGIQCGCASHQLSTYACTWTGTAASVAFLQPPSSSLTVCALGVHAGEVAGYYSWSTSHHACLWPVSGPAVDLNPAGATTSEALGVHSGMQVGWADAGAQHAALWTGTAASFVDLHPTGATSSIARAVHGTAVVGTVQVGEATIGGDRHASLWLGTAGSWVDLHAFVPPGHAWSVATGVWVDENGVVYVSGYHDTQGLLWIDTTSAVTTFCRGDGSGTACPCGNDAPSGSDTGCLSSIGLGGRLVASGASSLANDQLVLLGSQMPATSSVLYFQGTAQQSNGAGAVFGDGLRCVTGSVIRLGTKLNSGGSSSFPAAGDPTVSVRGQVVLPGVTRDYQAWYRNVAPGFCTPSAFNLTNGVAVSWLP